MDEELKAKSIFTMIIALSLFFLPFVGSADGADNFQQYLEENVLGGESSDKNPKKKKGKEKAENALPEKDKVIKPKSGNTQWNRFSNEEKAKAEAKREKSITQWERLSDEQKAELMKKRQKQKLKAERSAEKERAKARAKREKKITKWENLSDEEKAKLRKKRQEQKAKWQQMSDEEKAPGTGKAKGTEGRVDNPDPESSGLHLELCFWMPPA